MILEARETKRRVQKEDKDNTCETDVVPLANDGYQRTRGNSKDFFHQEFVKCLV